MRRFLIDLSQDNGWLQFEPIYLVVYSCKNILKIVYQVDILIRAGYHQQLVVRRYNDEDKEKDVLNFIVNHGFSFRTIEDPLFQRLTNVFHTRQWLTETLAQRAAEIQQTQFDIYKQSIDIWQQTPFILFWDGWLSSIQSGSRHLFCFMIKTPINIHFVGLKWTENKNDSLWLANTIKQLVEQLEASQRLRLVAFCGDNHSVNIASHKLLTGQEVKSYKNYDQATIAALNLKRSIPMLNCACHSLDLAMGDFVTQYNIKEKLQLVCEVFSIRFSYCPTRWFTLYTNLREVCTQDKEDKYDMNINMRITKLVSDAIGELERNGCTQEQAQNKKRSVFGSVFGIINKKIYLNQLRMNHQIFNMQLCVHKQLICNVLKALVVGEAEIERTFSFLRRQLDYTRSKLYTATLENILYVRIHDNMDYETQFEEYVKQRDNKEDETE
ncbi:Conserved_hypothetical protein [Hexamita inflata]|uniref:Uncharacterized protein n=1 Tax=Hexamita inflata TaxID=28002 RepID=A0AA86QJZ0_9EUKA|nr:Conserved hypothetical protein [Hexamita inflata]